MTTAALTQAAILAAIALFALGFAVRRLLPKTSARALASLANRLDAPGRSPFGRRLGRWLRPSRQAGAGCGSGDGCNRCGSCAGTSVPPAADDARPLVFAPKPTHDRAG